MHSHAIESAKSIVERITGNYTSSQLMGVFDTLLQQMCVPLIKNTRFFDRYIAMLIPVSLSRKRKIGTHHQNVITHSILVRMLITKSSKERIALWTSAHLERSFLFMVVDEFLTRSTQYVDLTVELERQLADNPRVPAVCKPVFGIRRQLVTIEQSVLLNKGADLQSLRNTVEFWHQQASEYNKMLVEKYTRHAVLRSVAVSKNSALFNFDLGDIFQNHIMSVVKAIGKFNPECGTLTSYIGQWFQDARNNDSQFVTHPMHVAIRDSVDSDNGSDLTILDSLSRDNELRHALGDDHESQEHTLDRMQSMHWVQRIARYADPTGIGRVSLDISEILE